MTKTTSIIDVPKGAKNPDLLGVDKYKTALGQFIEGTDTPITIAVQGEWGSGKTSLMNSLRRDLCGEEEDDLELIKNGNNEFYPVWVNTWQYSLMQSTSDTLMNVIGGITEEIIDIIETKHKGTIAKGASTGKRILSALLKTGAKTALSAVGVDGDAVVDAAGESRERGVTILKLRNELQNVINECLASDQKVGDKHRGFVFFIDDLDRIDPPVAVQILELLKNIFDLHNCIFVLAIDYDVVIKGLKPKFGELTDKNEREFRSFFDKIIQLPFSMPIASYQIDQFLIDSLTRIDYIDDNQKQSDEFVSDLTQIANLTVGTNPRALKRLCNTLSLINIINAANEDSEAHEDYESTLNFALVCMQIAYPFVYNQLNKEPNFAEWDDETAQRLKLKPLSEDEKNVLNSTEEFDEDWEKVLYRMCQKEPYLSRRVFQISTLLNKLRSIIPEETNIEDCIKDILELSSVTNLEAFDKQPVKDLNLNHLLKSYRTKFFPLFTEGKKDNITSFKQEGARIVKNLTVRYELSNGISHLFQFAPRVRDGKILFWIGSGGIELMNHDVKDFNGALKTGGIFDEFQSFKKDLEVFQKENALIEKFEFHESVISWKKKLYIKPRFWFGINFQNEAELFSEEGMQKVNQLVNEFVTWSEKLLDMGLKTGYRTLK